MLPLVALATRSEATVVERLDLDRLVATANTIVLGQVESTETYWSDDGRLILTRNTVRVGETLKGSPSSSVVVTTIGGTLDGITLYVAGMPEFRENEETVVFLEGTGVYRTVVGLGQGKFAVEGSVVSNDTSNLEFVGGVGTLPTRMTLDRLRNEVRRRLRPF